MAESKKRKLTHKGRPRNKGQKSPLQQIGNKILIKPHILSGIKDNPDLAALIRVGRLLNSLTYTMDLLSLPHDSSDPVQERRFHRTLINAGGYLYEGFQLAESVQLQFVNNPSFARLNALLINPDKRYRKIVQTIRNVAFHLDHANKVTKAALEKLVIKGPVTLISAENGEIGNLHFNLADVIDRCYLIDELVRVEQSEAEVMEEITTVVPYLIGEFAIGSEEFFRGLAKRLKLIDKN